MSRARKKRKPGSHPVCHFELEAGDVGYDKGCRYRIELADFDPASDNVVDACFYFPTLEDSQVFMEQHHMTPVSDDDMAYIRKALKDNK